MRRNFYESLVIWAHRAYKATLSPVIGRQCRYWPTCSDYARDALLCFGLRRGLKLAFGRLLRCHPWGGEGYDPLPSGQGERQEPCSKSDLKEGKGGSL